MMKVEQLYQKVAAILSSASEESKFYPHEVNLEPLPETPKARWVFIQVGDEGKLKITNPVTNNPHLREAEILPFSMLLPAMLS